MQTSPGVTDLAEHVQTLLASLPDPDSALHFLTRLRHEAPGGFERIYSSPSTLRDALHIFSYSNFLAETCLKQPDALIEASRPASLERQYSKDDYQGRLTEAIGPGVPAALDLASFRRRELIRIVLRDVLGLAGLSEITAELSNLADAILEVAYRRIHSDLAARHGEPRLSDGRPCGFSVISLGKLGGQELNYSSDIDLMFLYGGNGQTDGAAPISNK